MLMLSIKCFTKKVAIVQKVIKDFVIITKARLGQLSKLWGRLEQQYIITCDKSVQHVFGLDGASIQELRRKHTCLEHSNPVLNRNDAVAAKQHDNVAKQQGSLKRIFAQSDVTPDPYGIVVDKKQFGACESRCLWMKHLLAQRTIQHKQRQLYVQNKRAGLRRLLMISRLAFQRDAAEKFFLDAEKKVSLMWLHCCFNLL